MTSTFEPENCTAAPGSLEPSGINGVSFWEKLAAFSFCRDLIRHIRKMDCRPQMTRPDCTDAARSRTWLPTGWERKQNKKVVALRCGSTIRFFQKTWWKNSITKWPQWVWGKLILSATNFWLTNMTKICDICLSSDFLSEFVIKCVTKMWWWKRTFR